MDDPTPSDSVSLGDYPNGTVFRLVRGIRGSSYSVGDRFMLIAEEDCHSPNTLKLGGMGEGFFIDPAGKPLKIEADESQFRVIFEAVVESPPPEVVLTEGETVDPDPKLVTEEKFSEFRKGLAGVLTEIAAIRTERGERGPRGYTGVQGDRGERGEPGPQGEDGAVGAQGEPGPQGEVGPQGPQGPQGERGQRGEPGARGADGKQGTVGPMGPQGPQGERGPQGAPGVAGTMGPRGEAGTQGIPGKDGADGKDGTDGRDGKTGKAGPRGPKGDRGPVGARGEAGPKGDRGSTGESGVLTAKFPLVYDADEKSIAIDEERLDKILKKIMGGGKVSPQDMGWLASTGGGGKVAVYINGSKITPDVRTLDFTGAGVTASKVGGKVTVNFTGTGGGSSGGVASVNGLSGAVGITGGTDISVVPVGQTLTINYTGTSVSNVVTSFNGVTGAVQGVSSVNGFTGGITFSVGTGITFTASAGTITLSTTGGATGATGPQGQPGQSSNYYNYKVHTSSLTPPTTNGEIRYNNATQTSSTTLYVDHLDSNGDDIDVFLSLLKQNDTLIIQDANNSNNYQTWKITSAPTVILNDYVTIPVTGITSAGTGTSGFSNNHQVLFIVFSSPIATAYVESFNGLTGAIGLTNGNGIGLSVSGNTLTVSNSGVLNFNGLTGAVQGVSSFNGQTGAVSFHNYVASLNGLTGAAHAVTTLQGKSGPIGVCGGKGINIPNRITGAGNTFAVSLNYLSGGVAMTVEKAIDKDHFIAFQDDITQAMYISRASNLSYLILGASASSFTSGQSSTFLRTSRNIDDGNATTTDEYISVNDFFSSSTIDGGTFA